MGKNLILTALAASSLVSTATSCTQKEKKEEKKPNFVFILADDHTFECIGALGKYDVKTPNLDRMINGGTLFTHCFNQGAWHGAVSAASRSMLATGANLWKVRDIIANNSKAAKDSTLTSTPYWYDYMKDQGYDNYFSGKWHVDGVNLRAQKFDQIKHPRGGMPEQNDDCYNRKFIEGKPDKWTSYDESYGGQFKGGEHWAKVLKDDAVGYVDMAKNDDDPFFMYLAFSCPHDPRQAPKEYFDMYKTEDITLPENFVPEYQYSEDIGCGRALRDERLAPFPRTKYSVQLNRREYYALITYMDKQIGDILDALEASGKMDNTYIVYTADHGLSLGDHGMLGKQNMYDASMRAPMILMGPDIPKGKRVDNLVYIQDAMATALDVAGSPAVNTVDFKSLIPLAKGDTSNARKAIYGGYMHLQRMIRTEEYQMLIYPAINTVRLYNIKNDPYEMVDLAKDKKYHPKMQELFKEFLKLQEDIADQVSVTDSFNKFMEANS